MAKSSTPTQEQIDKVLEKVSQIAAMAGFNVGPHPESADMLVAGFEMRGGRSQMVYIRCTGQTPEGHTCICFMSPCLEVKRRKLGGGLSRKRAVDLLRRNAHLAFGSFGLYAFDSRDVVMVSSSQIVETMEVEEFRAHIMLVAGVADAYEHEQGRDEF